MELLKTDKKPKNWASAFYTNLLEATPAEPKRPGSKTYKPMVTSSAEDIAAWNAKVDEKKKERADRRLQKKIEKLNQEAFGF